MLFTSREYIGKRANFDDLSDMVTDFFKEEGFKIQSMKHPSGNIVQARKGGIFRALLGNNDAFTLIIDGHPAHFRIRLGVSEWLDRNSSGDLDQFFVFPFKRFKDIPEALWAYELEHHLWHYIENQIEFAR
ncbi:MAG: hypothetical protein QW812_03660 [Thermoplasmataceae archaeon]